MNSTNPCLFLLSEADAAEAEYVAGVNEVMGLQAEDDITTQAPLSTVTAIGENCVCTCIPSYPRNTKMY